MKIFMIGTQRSGSNLFRLMLNQLPDDAAPHPPHILIRMMPLVASYGDLADPENLALLVDDACRLVEANPVEWDGVKLDRADIARRCDRHDLFAVMAAIYDALSERWGKTSWCCKSLGNVKYADQLADRFPEAKFIYLYRDGRDVALSFTKAIEGEKHYTTSRAIGTRGSSRRCVCGNGSATTGSSRSRTKILPATSRAPCAGSASSWA